MVLRHLLSFLFVCCGMVCLLIWAGWQADSLDFLLIGKHAAEFPLGAERGPLAGTFGCLFAAYLAFPRMVYAYVTSSTR